MMKILTEPIVKTLALKYLFCLVCNIFYILTFTHLEDVITDDLNMYVYYLQWFNVYFMQIKVQ